MADIEEELDYHITFPTPGSFGSSDDDENPATGGQQEPVIVLLGWLGCQDKHLTKYTAIYEKRCITIRYTAPADAIFYRKNNLKTIATKLLELLTDLQLAENPVFFHVFSNGGGFVYRCITELVHNTKDYSHIQIRGTVFDSCPAQRKLLIAGKAFFRSANHLNIIIRYLAAILLVIYLSFVRIIGTLTYLVKSESKPEDYWDAMMNDKCTCPQLFLYSKADDVVSFVGIEEIIKQREMRGVKVLSMCWEDTPHVGHFRKHRESYANQCQDFLNLCLGR